LAIITRRFMPPDRVRILSLRLSQHPLEHRRVGLFAEQAAGVADGCDHGLEAVGGQFLRDQADQRTSGAVVPHHVMAIGEDTA
jgi:hypothetical protein